MWLTQITVERQSETERGIVIEVKILCIFVSANVFLFCAQDVDFDQRLCNRSAFTLPANFQFPQKKNNSRSFIFSLSGNSNQNSPITWRSCKFLDIGDVRRNANKQNEICKWMCSVLLLLRVWMCCQSVCEVCVVLWDPKLRLPQSLTNGGQESTCDRSIQNWLFIVNWICGICQSWKFMCISNIFFQSTSNLLRLSDAERIAKGIC